LPRDEKTLWRDRYRSIVDLERHLHPCHRIRGSSSGIATPSWSGITRTV
jgi:hypothetical protein